MTHSQIQLKTHNASGEINTMWDNDTIAVFETERHGTQPASYIGLDRDKKRELELGAGKL